jgi:hypothetical protein
MKLSYGSGADTQSYPASPPLMKFLTHIFHTNVSSSGSICMDILTHPSKWSALTDFTSLISYVLLLFEDQNSASPYNTDAGKLFDACRREYLTYVKQNKGCTVNDDILYEKAFQAYKKTADSIASKNDLKQYAKWFPQIIGEKRSDEEQEMLNQMFKKYLKLDKPKEEKKKPDKNKWKKLIKNSKK